MKYKPVEDRCCQNENVRITGSSVIVISSAIRYIKRDRGEGGVISVRPVKRPSVQQRERHTIDSTNLVLISMKWFK